MSGPRRSRWNAKENKKKRPKIDIMKVYMYMEIQNECIQKLISPQETTSKMLPTHYAY